MVLPKYGFEGSRAGVYKMMAAMGPYAAAFADGWKTMSSNVSKWNKVEQPEFTDLAEEINSLGLSVPTWSTERSLY